MVYVLSSDASAIRGTGNGETKFWVRVSPAEYNRPFIGTEEMLFSDWRKAKLTAEKMFVEQQRQAEALLEWLDGQGPTQDDKNREEGFILDYKKEGRTIHGKLLLKRDDGGELAPGLRCYLTDDQAEKLLVYMDLTEIDSPEKANEAFAAARKCAEYLRENRIGYILNSGGNYISFDTPEWVQRIGREVAARKAAEKVWTISSDEHKIVLEVMHPDKSKHRAVMVPGSWMRDTTCTTADIVEQNVLADSFKVARTETTTNNPQVVPGVYSYGNEFFIDVRIYDTPYKVGRAYESIRRYMGLKAPRN